MDKIVSPPISRRKFIRRTAVAAATAAAVYAVGVEPRWVSVERRQLPIPDLPESLAGKIAVQISDLHIGSRVGDEYLRAQFDYVKSISPDFVFFTGDFLDSPSDWHLGKAEPFLKEFPRGSIGTACVLGNHDFGCGQSEVIKYATNTSRLIDLFERADLNLLLDQSVDLGGLHVAGLRDFWFGGFDRQSAALAIESVRSQPAIVLSHNPDTVDLPIWDSYRSWVLCGHTHGGQCNFPLVGAPVLPVANKRYVAGSYDIQGGHKMYISRGIGHTHRVRFMARPEITIFDLAVA
jgi:predicted MPP superfamily phosphohydrolase